MGQWNPRFESTVTGCPFPDKATVRDLLRVSPPSWIAAQPCSFIRSSSLVCSFSVQRSFVARTDPGRPCWLREAVHQASRYRRVANGTTITRITEARIRDSQQVALQRRTRHRGGHPCVPRSAVPGWGGLPVDRARALVRLVPLRPPCDLRPLVRSPGAGYTPGDEPPGPGLVAIRRSRVPARSRIRRQKGAVTLVADVTFYYYPG